MNKSKITGIVIAVLGLITALIPTVIFKVCEAMEGKFMKCHWTSQTEVAIGIVTLVLGVLIILTKEKAAAAAYSVASAINGLLVILIPTVVIGVCGSADMPCHSGTKPALIIAGALIVVVALIHTALYLTSKKKV
ncbi:MAG: DUF4418 family protein [Clostridiales bacterium]|nr:DUF4418 family protein [Clostridiales bacterium]